MQVKTKFIYGGMILCMNEKGRKNPTGSVPKPGRERVTLDLPAGWRDRLKIIAIKRGVMMRDVVSEYLEPRIAADEKRLGIGK